MRSSYSTHLPGARHHRHRHLVSLAGRVTYMLCVPEWAERTFLTVVLRWELEKELQSVPGVYIFKKAK